MPAWTYTELQTLWRYPDWTAEELHELVLSRHSVDAIQKARSRYGRYNRDVVGFCQKCEERPVWEESADARRYGLCKSCYLDEEKMRIDDAKKSASVRQARRRARKRGDV